MAARLVLRRGTSRHELFSMIGHRYLVAIARATPGPIPLRLALRQTVYPFAIRGSFTTNDPTLNDIYRISVNTQRICALDSYVDTPWREQAQWWGDARVQAQNTFHICGDTRLLVRGIRSLAQQQVPNGLTYGHAPTSSHHCILPDFSLTWALTVWDYYYQTGDISLFAEQWPRIERLLGYFTGEGRGANSLLRYDDRYWLFLDWCDIHKAGTPTLYNLWYLYTLQKLVALARVARMKPQQAFLQGLLDRQEQLILTLLFDRSAGLFRDGIDPQGQPVPTYAIHNQTLAILCGLEPDHHQEMIQSRLLPYLLDQEPDGPSPKPSSYWVTYVYGVMRDRGYGKQVIAHLRRNWAPMVQTGGTWETFGYDGINGTTSHAWAAHPIYHLTGTLAGLTQTAVGWKRVRFAPVLDVPGIDRAAAVVPSPRGDIQASWQRRGQGLHAALRLPPGVTAEVALPGIQTTVTGSRHWTLAARV